MRLTLTFVCALFLIATSLHAQDTREERKTIREQKRLDKWTRKDSIQSLPIQSYLSLDVISAVIPNPLGRLNIGYITPLNERWSIGGSAGVGINATAWITSKEDYFLWEVRPEVIYNLGKGKRFQHYLGVELFYISNKETLIDEDFEPVNTLNGTVNLISFERADYRRNKAGFLLNFGEYINFSDRWAFRTTVGIGARRKDISYANLINARIENDNDEFFFNLDGSHKEGTRWGVELNLDLRLIYKIL